MHTPGTLNLSCLFVMYATSYIFILFRWSGSCLSVVYATDTLESIVSFHDVCKATWNQFCVLMNITGTRIQWCPFNVYTKGTWNQVFLSCIKRTLGTSRVFQYVQSKHVYHERTICVQLY